MATKRQARRLRQAPIPELPTGALALSPRPEPPPGDNWLWEKCPYCQGQGWLTQPEWHLAWLNPHYPDMEKVEADLASVLGGRKLESISVREACTWCKGHGRRYGLKF